MHARVEPEPEGVLNVNKSGGMTSHDVVDEVRRILKIRRVGAYRNPRPSSNRRAAHLRRECH